MLDSNISLIPTELESTSSRLVGNRMCDKSSSSEFQQRWFFLKCDNNTLRASSSRQTSLWQDDNASTMDRATSALIPLQDFSSWVVDLKWISLPSCLKHRSTILDWIHERACNICTLKHSAFGGAPLLLTLRDWTLGRTGKASTNKDWIPLSPSEQFFKYMKNEWVHWRFGSLAGNGAMGRTDEWA